jgi:DNA-directed RNA polymerase subunit RPC12/RpoP
MRLIDMTCPHCGAQLKVDADQKQAKCDHCGTTILIDDEVRHVKYDGAEEAGYEFEKGRQKAIAEAKTGVKSSSSSGYDSHLPHKRKHSLLLWILMWLLIFPLPITILLKRNKRIKPAVKYGIIAIAWILYLVIVFAGGGNKKNEKASSGNSPVESAEATDSSKKGSESGIPEVVYADEDKLINDFITEYNSVSKSPITDVTNGNIRTKYYGSTYGFYCEFLHANDTGKIFITINETNENADAGIVGMRDAFHDLVKVIDNSLTDDQIYSVFDSHVGYGTELKAELGTMTCSFYKDGEDSRGQHYRGRIEINNNLE